MCVELRIRCSQPPSRGVFASLDTRQTRPELRDELAILLLTRHKRERLAEERRVSPSLSLLGIFGGHTRREADGPGNQRSIIANASVRYVGGV